MLELDEAGTTYHLAVETAQEQFEVNWEPVRLVLAEAPQKLTRQDILMEWPAGFDQPGPTALWRLLEKAVEQGLALREGSGQKSDPFRYWVAEREAAWEQDPLYRVTQAQRESLKLPFESLGERKEKLAQAGSNERDVAEES